MITRPLRPGTTITFTGGYEEISDPGAGSIDYSVIDGGAAVESPAALSLDGGAPSASFSLTIDGGAP